MNPPAGFDTTVLVYWKAIQAYQKGVDDEALDCRLGRGDFADRLDPGDGRLGW